MTESSAALLEVEDVVVRYPVRRGIVGTLKRERVRHVEAVAGVSLRVRPGELVALVGESGSGKTSLGHAALRLLAPAGGTVRFRGEDVTTRTRRELRPLRRHMQVIYQDPYEALDPRFDVRALLEQPLRIQEPRMSREVRRARVEEALGTVGLLPVEAFLGRHPHQLSGGQRQRVAIAASLVLGPSLLLADEPVSMLDVSVRAEIMALLASLCARGIGILLITHDLATAARYADRIAVMYLGRIVEEGPAREVIDTPRHPYARALLSVVPRLDPRQRSELSALQGEIPDASAVPVGCRFHPRCPRAIDRCREVDPRLEPLDSDGAHRVACIRETGDPAANAAALTPPVPSGEV